MLDSHADQSREFAVYRGRTYRVVSGDGHWPQIVLVTFEDDPNMTGLDRCAAMRYVGRNGIDHYRVGLEQLDALYESSDAVIEEVSLSDSAGRTEHRVDLLTERLEQQRLEFLEEQRRSAESNGFQTGVFAVYQGHTYPASHPPAVGSRITLTAPDDEAAGALRGLDADPKDVTGRTRSVPLAELEQWFRSTWTFHQGDQPFVSEGIREHRIRGRYVGSSWGYFNYVLNGDYEVAPLLRTLTDLTEERVDLLTTRG
jgi:hypothetical protein